MGGCVQFLRWWWRQAVDKATGEGIGFFFPNMPYNFYPAGLTRVGSSYYVLGEDHQRQGDYYVFRFDTDMVKTGEWLAFPSDQVWRPAIGTDGTQIIIARYLTNGRLVVEEYSTTGVSARVNLCLPVGSTPRTWVACSWAPPTSAPTG